MTMHLRSNLGAALLASLVIGPAVPARADQSADERTRAADFLAFAMREAGSYTFRSGEGGEKLPFRLHPEPILRWTNPVVGSVSGGVYLWTAEGRPEAVASIFLWHSRFHPRTKARTDEQTDEFQSLSLGAFVMERDGQPVWMPSRPGIELKQLPDAPAPAVIPAQRLRQMRDLAERFTGHQTDHKSVERVVRLLPQPIYRYEGTAGDLIDGALFVFVQGTDPQVFLVIEARRIEAASRWHYALARMTHEHLQVSDRGREIWNVPLLGPAEMTDRRAPYTQFKFDPMEAAAKPEGRRP